VAAGVLTERREQSGPSLPLAHRFSLSSSSNKGSIIRQAVRAGLHGHERRNAQVIIISSFSWLFVVVWSPPQREVRSERERASKLIAAPHLKSCPFSATTLLGFWPTMAGKFGGIIYCNKVARKWEKEASGDCIVFVVCPDENKVLSFHSQSVRPSSSPPLISNIYSQYSSILHLDMVRVSVTPCVLLLNCLVSSGWPPFSIGRFPPRLFCYRSYYQNTCLVLC